MSNHKNMDVTEILNPNFLNLYNQQISFLYSELVTLNSNIYILKKIQNFPFEIFCNSGDGIFFSIVKRNLYENSIIIISRIVTDTGSDVLTIPKFRNEITQNILPKYKDSFTSDLKAQKFDENTKNLLNKLHSLRNSRLAHLIKAKVVTGTFETFDLGELEDLVEKFNSLLQSLSFNTERIYAPLHYTEHNSYPTDIEKILLTLAQQSQILNLPEQSPEMWERYKARYPKNNVIQINRYRNMLGLKEM
ncbi:hypothetical protein [Lysinibacillus sp. LZ02]|uniref:AbiU2 domain-containing protein n=1 Tax=Lysinibacillus sp. LZ02 TaxID=3420668 RepID=UPI003D362ABE